VRPTDRIRVTPLQTFGARDSSRRASENIPKVASASFGIIRKQRAREKCFIRTSELLRNSRGVKRSAARITSVQSLRAADRRHGINRDAGVITAGCLAELTARFRQNVKHVHSVRPVTNGLVACTSGGRKQLDRLSVKYQPLRTNVCECWDDEGSDYSSPLS
jgi:hypothetical protein